MPFFRFLELHYILKVNFISCVLQKQNADFFAINVTFQNSLFIRFYQKCHSK